MFMMAMNFKLAITDFYNSYDYFEFKLYISYINLDNFNHF